MEDKYDWRDEPLCFFGLVAGVVFAFLMLGGLAIAGFLLLG
jgi:tetrahydromethanopterin S-methyltransferase subunit F